MFGDGSDTPEAPKSLEIAETNGVVSIAEHGSEHESADAGKRGEDGGVVVRLVCGSLLLEPLFEELVGVASMLSNEEQLLENQFDMRGRCFGGCRSDAERGLLEDFEDLLGLYSPNMVLFDKLLKGSERNVGGALGIEEELEELAEKRGMSRRMLNFG